MPARTNATVYWVFRFRLVACAALLAALVVDPIGLVGLTIQPTVAFAQAPSDVTWEAAHVTAAERAQVLMLARQAGIDKPARVREVVEEGPGRCPAIVVESTHTRFLHEISWAEVTLARDAPREGCGFGTLLAGAPHVGRFATWDRAEPQLRWLVEDGGWRVELRPDAAVRFEVAEQIAMAFHRGTVVDQRDLATLPTAPNVAEMADQITAVSAFPSQYTVRLKPPGTTGGWLASVYLDDGQVHLFSVARVASVDRQR